MAVAGRQIEVFNRYTGRVEAERIYGEAWLRWTYESTVAHPILHAFVKRVLFSKWYGWRMSRPRSAALIRPFIDAYGLDPAEFAASIDDFRSFNDFFSRALRPGIRPIDSDPRSVVFPADGRHLGFSELGRQDSVYAKGQQLSLGQLLGDTDLGHQFERGSVVISRLCPIDYHRFHFPSSGRAGTARLIPGALFSVSPIALRNRVEYLVENKRMVTLLEPANGLKVAVVEIGATCVGTIRQTYTPGRVEKGEEKGLFRFGGSCVITVFPSGAVALADDLVRESAAGRELYARMGDRMGLWKAEGR